MQQPLSYQTLPCSCWVTSVTNGLLCLLEDKNKIPGLIPRLLHSVLTDDGVGAGSSTSKSDWKIVLEAVAAKCRLDIRSYQKKDVEKELPNVDFSKAVVICDMDAGSHSVLLNGKVGDWYLGFDPDWDQVKKKSLVPKKYEIFPNVDKSKQGRINVKIHKNHLFGQRATKKKRFCMGAVSKRNITIISQCP